MNIDWIKWDRWVGSASGLERDATLRIKHLVHIWGRRLDLHGIAKADEPGCFHTHPALATRIILWGGYEEEVLESEAGCCIGGGSRVGEDCCDRPVDLAWRREWKPGMIGVVEPDFCHRISRVLRGPSYSLWLRGRITHKVRLLGKGWPPTAEAYDKFRFPAEPHP